LLRNNTHFFLYIYNMILEKKTIHTLIKTVFDYTIAVFCLILLIPVILILTIVLKTSGKGPVIYSQKRVGQYGKNFNIYKFRSMYSGVEDTEALISDKDDERITSLGKFMRKYRLDEIPNFINVLKGEMSIVGPRPEQQYFIDQIVSKSPQYKLLQDLKPGITSWGQVKYGYASNVDQMIERLEYDLYYLKKRSFWFDLKISFYTIVIIFKGKGI
jgi:lipopolysaccharide/colanic/teichoic acid biosynthesis glycosyltransferase